MRAFLPFVLLVAACAPEPTPVVLPIFGDGYRGDGDQCRRVGESELTAEFLDDAADLVACPADLENLGVFAIDTGGTEVARIGAFVLFTVPTR